MSQFEEFNHSSKSINFLCVFSIQNQLILETSLEVMCTNFFVVPFEIMDSFRTVSDSKFNLFDFTWLQPWISHKDFISINNAIKLSIWYSVSANSVWTLYYEGLRITFIIQHVSHLRCVCAFPLKKEVEASCD